MHPFVNFIILNFLLHLPFSFGVNDYRYTNCSQPFVCGGIRNISFPFWGRGRPNYCGQPGYELKCEDDDRIELANETPRYRVLSFNDTAQRIHIVPVDTWTDSCPAPSVNVSIPSPYFLPPTDNLTLLYDCPEIPLLVAHTNPCSLNDTPTKNYVWCDTMATVLPYAEVWAEVYRCRVIVEVPIPPTIAESVVNSQSTWLQEVLKEGFEVGYTFDSRFCRDCQDSGGQCGYNWTTNQPACFCRDREYQEKCPTPRPTPSPTSRAVTRASVLAKFVTGLGAAIGCVLVMVILIICCCKWSHLSSNSTHLSSNSIMFRKRKEKTQRVVEDFLKNYGSLVPRRYNYYDIKMITSSFKDKIGQGGFGEVYKGKLVDGRVVAVKLLNKANDDGEEFINEVASISRTSHVNVVNLLGFCFDGSKRALIYEFMANGSLEKFIYDQNPLEAESHLGWEQLYQIAIGVARGLEYLHRWCNTRILHFDIKPHNILLDQDFIPKISDFGLAKLCPRNESIISMLGARGTAGYIAPEVFSRQFGGVSHKSDVYSFGMMVLEIIGKRKNIDVRVDHTSEIYFLIWIYRRVELNEELGLHGITSKEEGEITRKMILVALWCIQTNPMDRPGMTKVVEMLEGKHESVSLPPKPYLCSPPRSPIGSS